MLMFNLERDTVKSTEEKKKENLFYDTDFREEYRDVLLIAAVAVVVGLSVGSVGTYLLH